MAQSPAQQSDEILRGAREARARVVSKRNSIGTRSAKLKAKHGLKALARAIMGAGAILVLAMLAGLALDGIGFAGIMLTGLALLFGFITLLRFPRMKTPSMAELRQGDVGQMVGKTQLWLEGQRAALPAPAVRIVDQLGGQLDALGLQLDGVSSQEPALAEVRKLVGEHLPEMITGYRRIPAHLRIEERNGRTPEQQLTDGLATISREVDSVTRQLAAGELDKLAVRERFLEIRYAGDDTASETGSDQ